MSNQQQPQKEKKRVFQKIFNENSCTYCGHQFSEEELLIDITLRTDTYRLSSSGIKERIENASLNSREILCKECFDVFSQILIEMNEKRKIDVSE